MDIPRKIGIAVVMIVPTFVVAGALWEIFHSYIPILIWVVVMAGFVAGLITKMSRRCKNVPEHGHESDDHTHIALA